MSDTLTRSRIVDMMHAELGFSKREARHFLDLFLDTISGVLARGETVKLTGFGRFDVRRKRARPGRNPATGEAAVVHPRRVVVFRASTTWSRRGTGKPKTRTRGSDSK